MDNEEIAELQDKVEAFRAVDETVKTSGWKKFLLPRFERLRQAHIQALMRAKDLPEVIRAQEGIKAIDMLTQDIDICIAEGQEAIETLAKEKEE